MAKRPDLKRPGLTATGRQWQTIEALRADGWLILDAQQAANLKAENERLREALRQARDCCARPTGVCFDPTLIDGSIVSTEDT